METNGSTPPGTAEVYLVERYKPGISLDDAMTMAARHSAEAAVMCAEGVRVRVVRSTLVAADEVLLCVVEARSSTHVAELSRRSGVPADRIVPAIDLSPGNGEAAP